MNLAPVSVEHSHGDCAGGPGQVGDKFERAHAASRVGAQFSNDIRRTVKILDSVLHFRDPRAQASWSMDRWLPSCCAAHCRERAPRPVLIGGRRGDKNCGRPAVRGRYAPCYRRSSPANRFLKVAVPKSRQFRIRGSRVLRQPSETTHAMVRQAGGHCA